MELIDIRISGVDPHTLHIHAHPATSTELLERLTSMESIMSDVQAALDAQTEAINANTAATQAMVSRVDEDVAHLQDLLAQQGALLDAAVATDAADAAAIADLTAQRDALQADADATAARIGDATASISASTTTLAGIDPDTGYPAAPVEEVPVEEVPVEPTDQ